jgi:hypothetical protein
MGCNLIFYIKHNYFYILIGILFEKMTIDFRIMKISGKIEPIQTEIFF